MDFKTILEAVVVLGSLAYNIFSARSNSRLNGADYASKVSKAATDLLAPYEKRLSQLERQVNSLTDYVSVLLRGIDLLIAQIERLGHVPAWRPPKNDRQN